MKSIKTNGHRITKANLIKFVSRDDYFGRSPLLDYLCHLEGVDGYPQRLDHWAADDSVYVYQVGSAWISIWSDDVTIVRGWLKEAGFDAEN